MIAYRSYKVIGKKIEEFVAKEENGNIIQRATIPRWLSTSEDIVIPNYITDISSFSSCMHNANAILSGMRGQAYYFGNVILHNNITNMQYAFANMIYFNQPITIPNSVTDCSSLLYGCTRFNQPITIPENATDCSTMFYGCYNFNQNIWWLKKVTNASSMFASTNMNQYGIVFNREIKDLSYCFRRSNIVPQHIYIRGKNVINAVGMLNNVPNTRRINVWIDIGVNSYFNKKNAYSIINAYITWTNMTNGFYNASKNIYVFTNYNQFS